MLGGNVDHLDPTILSKWAELSPRGERVNAHSESEAEMTQDRMALALTLSLALALALALP